MRTDRRWGPFCFCFDSVPCRARTTTVGEQNKTNRSGEVSRRNSCCFPPFHPQLENGLSGGRLLDDSLDGNCTDNEDFMDQNCAASCRVCALVLPDEDLCYYLESGPDIWKPGDLDRMFRRIVEEFQDDDRYDLEIVSSPDSTTVTTEEGDVVPGPWVLTIDGFLNGTEAERLIELGTSEGYERSTVVEEGVADALRTSFNSWCSRDGCGQDAVARSVLERISDMTQIPEEYSEDMQMLYYQPGQL